MQLGSGAQSDSCSEGGVLRGQARHVTWTPTSAQPGRRHCCLLLRSVRVLLIVPSNRTAQESSSESRSVILSLPSTAGNSSSGRLFKKF